MNYFPKVKGINLSDFKIFFALFFINICFGHPEGYFPNQSKVSIRSVPEICQSLFERPTLDLHRVHSSCSLFLTYHYLLFVWKLFPPEQTRKKQSATYAKKIKHSFPSLLRRLIVTVHSHVLYLPTHLPTYLECKKDMIKLATFFQLLKGEKTSKLRLLFLVENTSR